LLSMYKKLHLVDLELHSTFTLLLDPQTPVLLPLI
jgi:hypothetical protein